VKGKVQHSNPSSFGGPNQQGLKTSPNEAMSEAILFNGFLANLPTSHLSFLASIHTSFQVPLLCPHIKQIAKLSKLYAPHN